MRKNKKFSIKEKNVIIMKMLVLSGASASGKTEVARTIAKKYGLSKVITVTTREKRVGEQDGIDYFFVTKDEFLDLINNDKLVEYTVYNTNYYGSKKDQITDDRILVIEAEGLKKYISLGIPSIVTFALISDDVIRKERMINRGDKKEDIEKRLISDKVVFSEENLKGVNYFIQNINKTLEEVADEIYEKYIARLKEVE